MKLETLVNSVEALNKLAETKVPAGTSFKLGRFLEKADPEVKAYFKIKNEKTKEYGEQVMDGETPTDNYKIPAGKVEQFIADMKEVEGQELTLEIPEIKVSDLGEITIEPKYLSVLGWLIKE